MSLFKFKTPKNADQAVPEPQKRALLIQYHDDGISKTIKAQEERYKREGYVVQTVFLSSPKSREESTKKTTVSNNTLQDKLTWLKASENALLVFNHHGREPNTPEIAETPDYLKGEYTGRLLVNHGINVADLRKMLIRYTPCYGGEKEADDFVKALHEGGAGNLIVDAKTKISSTLLADKPEADNADIIRDLVQANRTIMSVDNIADFSQDPPVLKNTKLPIYKETLETYDRAKKSRSRTLAHMEYYRTPLKKGDSIIKVKSKEFPDEKIQKLPRTINPETGLYLYNPHYLAPVKTATSRVKKTVDPKEIAAFMNDNGNNLDAAVQRNTSKFQKRNCTIS